MGGKLLSSLTFARSHTGAATVLVDEFDAGQLQGAPNRQVVSSCHGRLAIGYSYGDSRQ